MAQQDDYQQAAAAEASVPCANNCGFFGNRTTMNLCSKCYRDSAKLMDIANPSPIPPPPSSSSSYLPSCAGSPAVCAREETGIAGSPPVAGGSGAASATAVAAAPGRCCCCHRKVGLMGIKCRCGKVVCFPHRYPSEHGCEFDYQADGRVAIAKANPLVVASKINKI